MTNSPIVPTNTPLAGTATRTQTPTGASATPSQTSSAATSTPTPSRTFSRTASPTPVVGGACAATDKLDLQISVDSVGQNPCTANYPSVMFRINNNSANPVNINTLSIKAWFLGTVTIGYWGGDNWRTTVYDSLNASQGIVTSTLTAATGTYGSMTSQLTFAFTDSVVIPAGGYVMAGTLANGALFQLKNLDATFDPTCSDYSNFGGATYYTPGTYYQNSGWKLYESGNPVCEYINSTTPDPANGIPAGGATCNCPTGPSPTSKPNPSSSSPTASFDHDFQPHGEPFAGDRLEPAQPRTSWTSRSASTASARTPARPTTPA